MNLDARIARRCYPEFFVSRFTNSPNLARASIARLALGALLAGLVTVQAQTSLEPAAEQIVLGVSRHARVEQPQPGPSRPVLDIHLNGRVFAAKQQLYDPQNAIFVGDLRKWLSAQATHMSKARRIPDDLSSTPVPSGELLIRADHMAPFWVVQILMEECRQPGVSIWKIEFAARRPDENGTSESNASPGPEGKIALHLPLNRSVLRVCEPPGIYFRVRHPGEKLSLETGEPLPEGSTARFSFGPRRQLWYTLGPQRTFHVSEFKQLLSVLHKQRPIHPAILDPGLRVTCGEALEVMDVFLDANMSPFLIRDVRR